VATTGATDVGLLVAAAAVVVVAVAVVVLVVDGVVVEVVGELARWVVNPNVPETGCPSADVARHVTV
jgi:hypothetical protein